MTAIQPSSVAMLSQFSVALQELVESGAWDRDVELEVKIAGTLKNDKSVSYTHLTLPTKRIV